MKRPSAKSRLRTEGSALIGGFRPLPESFYSPSAREVAPQLLGHWLLRQTKTGLAGGLIVETEAYLHNDPACHGFRGPTRRNRAMFGAPGRAYVYFIYGNHWCFNAVCQPDGVGEAVLVRAIEPRLGTEAMMKLRPVSDLVELTNGPAKFCQALAIDGSLDGSDLTTSTAAIFLADNPQREEMLREQGPIVRGARIGIREAADWPLRFYIANNRWVSRRSLIDRSTKGRA